SRWELVEPSRRNECLDTMNYSEAAARKKGWAAMTEEQWAQLEAERGIAPPEAQGDLFDLATPAVPLSERAAATGPRRETPPPQAPTPAPEPADHGDWLGKTEEDWL